MGRLTGLLFWATVTWPLVLVAGLYLYFVAGEWVAIGLLTYCASSSVGLVRIVPYLPEMWREMRGGSR